MLPEDQRRDPLIGQVLDGRYRIEAALGEGGMGLVYRAVHTTLEKPLAIKVLRPEVSKDEQIVARFKQEAQSASAIGNQHIIDISDFGVAPDGSTYFVMEFLTGQALTDALEEGRFSTARTVHIAKQLCKALGAAHDRGIVHRDMKPDNVQLIDRGGDPDFVKVLDFGIAKVGGSTSKLTQAGQVFGTPHYMSPEQCAGTTVDHRTDIYAVGIMLYEMATGGVPFDADNLMGILTKHLYENPIPPHELPPPVDVPAEVEAVILKCLAKKPEYRYQTMSELLEDLKALEAGDTPNAVVERVDRNTGQASVPGLDAPGSVTVGLGQPQVPVKKPLVPIAIGAVVLIGALLAVMSMGGEEPKPEEANVVQPAPPPEPAPAVEPEPEPEPEEAPPPPPQVAIDSSPSGAELYKEDILLGNTPLSLDKPPKGESTQLELRLSGYDPKSFRITSRTGNNLKLTLKKQAKPRPRATKKTKAPSTTTTPPKRPRSRSQTEVLDPWD
ncbi:MAG: protein kinase [Myxococcales bacterium]|nr:protein kinase [Myxococcales bacterium]